MAEGKDFKETRFDYSEGRKDAPELTIMVGISGSGKSFLAKDWTRRSQGKIMRLNRDSMRQMMWCGADAGRNKSHEEYVREGQRTLAIMSLQRGRDVLIDDTNCIRFIRQKWEEIAKENRAKFRIVTMTTPIEVCIERDSKREGVEKVGEGVILQQHKQLTEVKVPQSAKPKKEYPKTRPFFERTEFLVSGGWVTRLPNAPWILVDIDGTLATTEDGNGGTVRHQHDETRVLHDNVREIVAEWVRQLYPHYNICIVSGRHDYCGDDTCEWLEMHGIPFDHILMRYSGDNRSDVDVKQEILNELSAVIGKHNIAFVIDDRPRVVEMWRSNGIKVYPVRGTWDHSVDCSVQHTLSKGYKTCPECAAIEYF